MPTFTMTKNYDDGLALTEAMLDAMKSSTETFFNVTKLDSDNIQAGGVATANLANASVTESKLATSVAGSGLTGGGGSALAVVVDDATIELSGDAIRVKDSGITTVKINDAAVTSAKLAAAVAGDGLTGGAGTALAVVVDGSTIEISSDTLRVKDLGISTAKLASEAVTEAKLASGAVTAAKIAASVIGSVFPVNMVQSVYTSGSGSHPLHYAFFCNPTATATATATYTNNGVTFTVRFTVSGQLILSGIGDSAPSATGTLTKTSGTGDNTITFYAVRAPIRLACSLVGAGGGGSGSGETFNGNTGGTGQNTTFGTSLFTGGGGSGATSLISGAGGVSVIGAAGLGHTRDGAKGQYFCSSLNDATGGAGGASSLNVQPGVAGRSGGLGAMVGEAGGRGCGGGGGSGYGPTNAGCGGGAGGSVYGFINNPTGYYAYAIGSGGAAGTAGTNGAAGGAGGEGFIIVEEYYE